MGTIILAYKTMEDLNATGITGIFQTAAEAVPMLPGMILLGLFTILAMISYFSTQRRFGRGDLPASCAVSGFVTFIVSLVMTLIPNFITNVTIIPCLVAEIGFVFWLLISRE